jgi:hypothetical protein
MACSVQYKSTLDAVTKAEVRKLINKYKYLIPGWLQSLDVMGWQDQDSVDELPHITAEMTPVVEYRYATLVIYPKWRQRSRKQREVCIAHELTHILCAPLDSFIDGIIHNLAPEDMHEVLIEQHRIACESITEDIAQAIYKRESR